MTNNTNQDAIIEDINLERINIELNKGKVVIIAGFQGINENGDITTLGRGGSDTTAVAIAAKVKADHCYIYSDVDGVYTTDPNKVNTAKKLECISYKEMLDIADEGAKVLHNRCIEIGERFKIPIVAKCTFTEGNGTTINENEIEGVHVKSIVKNDKLIYVNGTQKEYSLQKLNQIYSCLVKNEIKIINLVNNSKESLNIDFIIPKDQFTKFANLIENELTNLNCTYTDISRVSIIGNGIMSNNVVLKQVIEILNEVDSDILSIETNEAKISIMFKNAVSDDIIEILHNKIIK